MKSQAFINCMKKVVRPEEGEQCNVKGDGGGYTYQGIAETSWGQKYPRLFARVRANLKQGIKPTKDLALQEMVDDFYYNEWWTPLKGDLMPEPVALSLINAAINSGAVGAIKRTYEACGLPASNKITEILIQTIHNMPE